MSGMLTIYENTTTDFSGIGLGVLVPSSAEVGGELNGDYEVTISHPYDINGKWQRIETGRIITANTPDGRQPFRIYYNKPTMDGIEVKARHIFYDLLDNAVTMTETTSGANLILQAVKDALKYPMPFNFSSNIEGVGTIYAKNDNPISVILGDGNGEDGTKSFYMTFGGEIKRDGYNVQMLTNIGTDRGVFIAYRKNLIGLEVSEDISNVATRVYPIGKDGLTLAGSDYIDSPYINSYPYPKILYLTDDSVTTQTGLQELVNNFYASGGDLPLVNIKVSFQDLAQTAEYKDYAQLEEVKLGDTVTIINQKMGFVKKAKVISYKYDALLNRYNEIELGDFSPTISSPITKGANSQSTANNAISISQTAEALLQSHLVDYNNPHHVTAEQTGGGSGGTSDYNQLTNKPQINGVELVGNKTSDDLGIISDSSTILNGDNPPLSSLGVDGNYYIRQEQIVQDEHTLLLLHGDTLTDSSIYNVPITNNGVTVSTAQSKFGGSSLYFNGNSYLSIAMSVLGLNFNSDWTLEWWDRPDAGNVYSALVFRTSSTGDMYGFCVYSPSEKNIRIYAGDNAWNFIPMVNIGTDKGQIWTHRAICKKNNTVYCFENGIKTNEVSTSGSLINSNTIYIGASRSMPGSASGGYIGYLDEIRVSNIARWTENFTPPTEPYNVNTLQAGEIYYKTNGSWQKILTGAN